MNEKADQICRFQFAAGQTFFVDPSEREETSIASTFRAKFRVTDKAGILKDAATAYKVDAEAIATKVRHEFTTKAKTKKEPKSVSTAWRNWMVRSRQSSTTLACRPRWKS